MYTNKQDFFKYGVWQQAQVSECLFNVKKKKAFWDDFGFMDSGCQSLGNSSSW